MHKVIALISRIYKLLSFSSQFRSHDLTSFDDVEYIKLVAFLLMLMVCLLDGSNPFWVFGDGWRIEY